jgi:hypothetical protein
MTTQGIPDDFKRADDLPLDLEGALLAAVWRLVVLEQELGRVREALGELLGAVEARR